MLEFSGVLYLAQLDSSFFLNPTAGGTGPELKNGGAPVVAGAYGGWAPIGVEQVSGGYRVAWKLAGTDQYTVWSTDADGNFVSNTGGISGSSATFQAYEPIFQQDLNGDGTIGVSAFMGTVIESSGSTKLVQIDSNYFLNPVTGGTG